MPSQEEFNQTKAGTQKCLPAERMEQADSSKKLAEISLKLLRQVPSINSGRSRATFFTLCASPSEDRAEFSRKCGESGAELAFELHKIWVCDWSSRSVLA